MSRDQIRISLVAEAFDGEGPIVSSPQSVPPATQTVLLVEDEQMVRTLVRHILEALSFNVLEAESGCEALEICKAYVDPVHLLISDVVMPQMSGPQLSLEVIKKWPDIGILFMSGYDENIMANHDLPGNKALFLQKPFSAEALGFKVREMLMERRIQN